MAARGTPEVRRLTLVAASFAKLTFKRISTFEIMNFRTKHKINYDWLLGGELKGLARMEQRRKDAEAAASHPDGAQGYFLKIFRGLNERYQEMAITIVRKLTVEQRKASDEAGADRAGSEAGSNGQRMLSG